MSPLKRKGVKVFPVLYLMPLTDKTSQAFSLSVRVLNWIVMLGAFSLTLISWSSGSWDFKAINSSA